MATKLALAVLVAASAVTHAQPAPQKITVGMYAPTVEFGSATARLAYVQSLGRAIEQATGIPVEAQPYANLTALKKDNVDFAIVDGPCYATNLGWRLLANAQIGGGTQRAWALYSSAGATMQALRGKKLAVIAMGCNDGGFVDNAMLESELDPSFFAARVSKPDLTAAIAEVAAVKAAHAVFAPTGTAKGLTKVFDTGAVPNPAFVVVGGTKLPASTVDKVAAAVVGYGGSGAIAGWTKPSRDPYASFAARLARITKPAMLATPEPVRIDARDVLLAPKTLDTPALVGIRHHFVRGGARME